MSDGTVIVLTGALAAIACALPGCFLVLRGMSLLGDAISHAVLPGIVLAFFLSGSVASLPVVLGAGAMGLFTVFLIESLHRTGRVKEDASIAVVFPALFAVGVLLIAQFTHGQKDLDQDCVLYGEIAFAPLRTLALGGFQIARPALVLAIVALANLLFVLLLYKELKISTFDSALAATVGLAPALVHYLLMGIVSVTTVASFESIGAILVVAFLIVPPAAAHLLTDRISRMLPLACLLGAGSAAAGYAVASAVDASIAGCMAGAMGATFLLAWAMAPRDGLLSRLLHRRAMRERVKGALLVERLLRAPAPLSRLAEELAWAPRRLARTLALLRAEGYVEGPDSALRPTHEGIAFARGVVE
ncbi:MAG: metal ABC transporter permease [Planctomycetaceae bacterium]